MLNCGKILEHNKFLLVKSITVDKSSYIYGIGSKTKTKLVDRASM